MIEEHAPKSGAQIILCPQCGYPLPTDARTCPQCGIDLILFALLAEKSFLEGLQETAPIPATPPALVPRIGQYMIEQGLLTQDKLEIALERQKKLADQGKHILLGKTLLQMGFIDRETLDRAITQQIIELHAALQETNRSLERRVAERTAELRRTLERLTDLNQIKANLISNISHELRTPLTHIQGYADLISKETLGPLTPDQAESMRAIMRAIDRLSRLIEDLVEFSTASREGIQLNLKSVRVPELTDAVLERSKEKAEKADVTLKVDLKTDLPPIYADQQRLSWVLFQLVDNGIKFTPAGGIVTLRANLNDERVVLSVQDTGIGIPADKTEEIFDAFHQLDGSATRRYGGTGLGLALVRLILDAHGSEMQIKSEEGKGSTFSFLLPIAADSK